MAEASKAEEVAMKINLCSHCGIETTGTCLCSVCQYLYDLVEGNFYFRALQEVYEIERMRYIARRIRTR
jgi:hypothetical protein